MCNSSAVWSLGMMCDLLHSGGLFGGDFTAVDFSTVTFSPLGIFSTFIFYFKTFNTCDLFERLIPHIR